MGLTIFKLAMVAFVAALPMTAGARSLCSATAFGDPATITTGVVSQAYTVSCPQSANGGPSVQPTKANMHRVTVDLTIPSLSVRTSVPADASGPQGAGIGGVFAVAPVSAVFADPRLRAAPGAAVPQIAINAHLFTNCCTTAVPPPEAKAFTFLRGLEVANGKVVVPALANSVGTGIPYATFASSLVIDRSGHGAIWTAGHSRVFPSGIVAAVTGSHWIVGSGTNLVAACSTQQPCSAGTWLGPNARTGVGLDGPSSLVMLVVDGVDNAEGLTLYQFGDIFAQMARTAINLDGGGSSTMVRRDGTRGFTILNTLNGAERDVGSILYVAAPDRGSCVDCLSTGTKR